MRLMAQSSKPSKLYALAIGLFSMRITIFIISAIIFIALVMGKKSYEYKKEDNLIPISKKQWPINNHQA